MARPYVELSTKELVGEVTVTVKVKRYAEWRIRLWVAMQLIKLAAWVGWFNIEIEGNE